MTQSSVDKTEQMIKVLDMIYDLSLSIMNKVDDVHVKKVLNDINALARYKMNVIGQL